MLNRNYYEILGIEKTAKEDQIRKRYYELSKELHSDHHADESNINNAEYKLINEAYSVLSDKIKRKEYDAGLADASAKKITGLSFAIQDIPTNTRDSSTALVAYQSYNLLDVMQKGKISKEELYADAMNNEILAEQLLEDKQALTLFNTREVKKLQDKFVNVQTQTSLNIEKKSESNTSNYSDILSGLEIYKKAINSKETTLELLANKKVMDKIKFYPEVMYNIAKVDLDIFYKVIEIECIDIAIDKKALASLLDHYQLEVENLPNHPIISQYKNILKLKEIIKNYDSKIDQIVEIGRVLAKPNLHWYECKDFIAKPIICKILSDEGAYSPIILKHINKGLLEHFSADDKIAKLILSDKEIRNRLSDPHQFIVNTGIKNLETCKYILSSNLKTEITGKDLKDFINTHGTPIALIIENDLELSNMFSAFQKYEKVKRTGFKNLSQQSVSTLQSISAAEGYFRKGEDYNQPTTLSFAAEFYYKAACLDHELALAKLVDLHHLLHVDYKFHIAELYNNNAMNFYDPQKAVDFYKLVTLHHSNLEYLATSIYHIAAFITTKIYEQQFDLFVDNNFEFLTWQKNRFVALKLPGIAELIIRTLVRLCLSTNAINNACNLLYEIETVWTHQDYEQIIDLSLQAIECQASRKEEKIGKTEEELLKFSLDKFENIFCKYTSTILAVEDLKNPLSYFEKLAQLNYLTSSILNAVFNNKFLAANLSLSTTIHLCKDKLLNLSPESISTICTLVQDTNILYKFGSLAWQESNDRSKANPFWEAALVHSPDREQIKLRTILQNRNLTLLQCDAIFGYGKKIVKLSQEKLVYSDHINNESLMQLMVNHHNNKLIEKLICRGIDFNVVSSITWKPILQRNYAKKSKELLQKIAADNLSLFSVTALYVDSLHGNVHAKNLINHFIWKGHCESHYFFVYRTDLHKQLDKFMQRAINILEYQNLSFFNDSDYSERSRLTRLVAQLRHEQDFAKKLINTKNPIHAKNYIQFLENIAVYFSQGIYIQAECELQQRRTQLFMEVLLKSADAETYENILQALLNISIAANAHAHAFEYQLLLQVINKDFRTTINLGMELIKSQRISHSAKNNFINSLQKFLENSNFVNDEDALHIIDVITYLLTHKELTSDILNAYLSNEILINKIPYSEHLQICQDHLLALNFSSVTTLAKRMKNSLQLYQLGRQIAIECNIYHPLVRFFWYEASLHCNERNAKAYHDLLNYYPNLSILHSDAMLGYLPGLINEDENKLNQINYVTNHYNDQPHLLKMTPLSLLVDYRHNKIIENLISRNINFNIRNVMTDKPLLYKNYKNDKRKLLERIECDYLSLYTIAQIRVNALNGDKRAKELVFRFKSRSSEMYFLLNKQDTNRELLNKIIKYIHEIENVSNELKSNNSTYKIGQGLNKLASSFRESFFEAQIFLEKNHPIQGEKYLINLIKLQQERIQQFIQQNNSACTKTLKFLSNTTRRITLFVLPSKYANFFNRPKVRLNLNQTIEHSQSLLRKLKY